MARRHLERDVGRQHIAGMVQYNEDNPCTAVRQAQGFQTAWGAGRGKNLSRHAYIEHAFAHETTEARLVPATSQSDNSYHSRSFGFGSRDQITADELYLSGMSERQPFEQLPNDVFGAVDELLHSHGDGVLPPVR